MLAACLARPLWSFVVPRRTTSVHWLSMLWCIAACLCYEAAQARQYPPSWVSQHNQPHALFQSSSPVIVPPPFAGNLTGHFCEPGKHSTHSGHLLSNRVAFKIVSFCGQHEITHTHARTHARTHAHAHTHTHTHTHSGGVPE